MALTMLAQRQLEDARPLFQEALDLRRQTLGGTHPHTLTSLHNLALVVQSQGELEAARSLLQQAFDLRRQTLGEAHPDTLSSQVALESLSTEFEDDPDATTAMPSGN